MAFLITKTGSSLPWWSFCTRAVLLLFEEIPVAHTGFSHIHSRGLSKKEPSLLPQSFKEEQHVLHLELFAPETHLGLFSFLVMFQDENKTTGRRQSDDFFPSKPKTEFHNDNERHLIYNTYVAYDVLTIRIFTCPAQTCFHIGHYGSKHSFSPEADGQKQDTLVLPPLLESNCLSLMFH